ncbi:MAG: hypothetical protein LUD14_09280 [Clostridiales bacterium]|nr:hypothetical protein [Clostridiales bacterium]
MTEQDFERLCTVVDQTNANDADKEALKHALKYQFTVSCLEASLRGGHDYDYIINAALTATREFYDADSVLFANTDVNLHVAGSLMRELPREGFPSLSGNDPVYLSKYPLFLKAIEYGQPVAVADMSQMFPTNSVEYKRLCKGKVSSFMAVPYKKRNTGFVGVINPHRYQDRIDLLQVLSYVVVAEINESALMEILKKDKRLIRGNSDRDVYVKLIGGLEIHSANGILTEEHFKSNRNVRFLTLLLLKNHRGFSTEEMVNALWETDAAPTSAKKIVSNVCSAIRETMRQHFPDMDLIVYENSEYRISSYYNVRTDYQEVQDLYAAANGESDKQKKADLLYQALTSHPGRLLPSQVDTPGVMPVIADYTYERKDKIKECMKLLYEVADYRRMLLLEEEVFVFYYDDPELIVWVIRAYIGLNHLGTAREFLQSWHKKLPKETYWQLEREIKEAKK